MSTEKTPLIPQKKSYGMEMEPGTYAWCSCGRSATQPFCDGSHRGTEFTPIMFEVTEKRFVKWCGCKYSKNGAICDGEHKRLP